MRNPLYTVSTYRCFVCLRSHSIPVEKNVIRYPVGWEKDDQGRWRCPNHKKQSSMATLGELIAAKKR